MDKLKGSIVLIIMLAVLLLAIPMTVYAETSGTCGDNLTWVLDDEGVLAISGTGAMKNYYSNVYAPWGTSVKRVVIEKGVTSIGNYAFHDCTDLTSATLPEGVTSIGLHAFSGCNSLNGINIPGSVTSIATNAFFGCNNISEVHIDSIESWLRIDFSSSDANPCYQKGRLYINGQAPTKIVIPEGITRIGTYAFKNCSSLTSIVIPQSVTTIEYGAFADCSSLTSMEIPQSVTTIASRTFFGCSSLTSVGIPESVTAIGFQAFAGCSSLTSIAIPTSVTSLDRTAFTDCVNLSEVTIPGHLITGNVVQGYRQTFDYFFPTHASITKVTISGNCTQIGESVFADCSSLVSVHIPSGVVTIGNYAFENCSALVDIVIPQGVTTIGYSAFENCSALTSIVIPEGVTTIADSTFEGCTALASVELPGSVTRIASFAFYDCSSLDSIILPDHLTVKENGAFSYTTKLIANPNSITAQTLGSYYLKNAPGCKVQGTASTGMTLIGYSGSKDVVLPEGITSVSSSLFKNSSITSIVFPESITSIDSESFMNCSALERVTFQGAMTFIDKNAFKGCSSLHSINLPDSLTSIGESAFAGCNSLTSITLPDNIQAIGVAAFPSNTQIFANHESESAEVLSCTRIYSQKYDTYTYTPIAAPEFSFSGSAKSQITLVRYTGTAEQVIIPSYISYIGPSAFEDCKSLTKMVLPDNIRDVGERAFSGCSSLREVVLPTGITSISNYMFYGCDSLVSITIPSGVKTVGAGSFYACDALKNVIIPDSVVTINGAAFYACPSLASITLPDNISTIHAAYANTHHPIVSKNTMIFATSGSVTAVALSNGSYTFCIPAAPGYMLRHQGVDKLIFEGYRGTATRIVIPQGVTSISYTAFTSEDNIESITFPSSVILDSSAPLDLLTNLTEVIIENGTTQIHRGSFSGCSRLTSVKIPDSVTTIGEAAFADCVSLDAVVLPDHIADVDVSTSTWATDSFPATVTLFATPGSMTAETLSTHGYRYSMLSAPDYLLRSPTRDQVIAVGYRGDSTNLVFPEGVTHIGDAAFDDTGITSVVLPSGVTYVGEKAFWGCDELVDVVIHGNVSIGKLAFGGCHKLKNLTIYGTADIGGEAFSGCSSLENLKLHKKVNLQYGCFHYCSSLTNLVIPKGTTFVQGFEGATSLTNVEIPDTVTEISSGAFRGCNSLTSIVLPASVRYINLSAFERCSNLTSITFLGREEISIVEGTVDLWKAITIYCYEYSAVDFWATERRYKVVYLDEKDPTKPVSLVIPDACSLWSGGAYAITPVLTPAGDASRIQWSSSDDTVATVTSGTIMAVGAGNAVITAKYDNLSAQMLVSVRQRVESLALSAPELWLVSKESAQITIIDVQPGTASPTFTWESSNTTSVTVDKQGGINALVPGDAIVTVTSDCGVSRSCIVHVCYPVTNVQFEQELQELALGETRKLKALVTTQNQSLINQLVVFTTSNPATAIVDDHGTVMAVGPGETVISAIASSGVSGQCTVSVTCSHVSEIIPAVVPTCNEPGKTEGAQCSICGEVLMEQEEIPALGHSFDEGVATIPPDCTNEGVTTYTCAACGVTYMEEVDALGHPAEIIPAIDPTCTASGLAEGTRCAVCDEILLAQEEIPALGHSFDDGVTTSVPDCVTEGVMTYTCVVCGNTDTEIIPALDHLEEIIPGIAPACAESGLTEGVKCAVCGEIFKEQTEIPAVGHIPGEGIVTKRPTPKEPGVRSILCSSCGELLGTEIIPAGTVLLLGDANDDGIVDIADALLIFQYEAGWNVDINVLNADVNADGSVNSVDALLILQGQY